IDQATYSYQDGRVTAIVYTSPNSDAPLAEYHYAYESGRLSWQSIDGTETNFGYNDDGELTSAGGYTYQYDANGNRQVTYDPTNGYSTYSTDDNNQISSDGTWTYGYDNNGQNSGHITSKTKSGESWTYTYNGYDKLTHAEQRDGENTVLMQ